MDSLSWFCIGLVVGMAGYHFWPQPWVWIWEKLKNLRN